MAHCRRLRRRSSTRARSSASRRTSRTGATSHQGRPPPPAVAAIARGAGVRQVGRPRCRRTPPGRRAGWWRPGCRPAGPAPRWEAPAQQGGRVAPGVQVAVHHRGHQGVAAAGGGADEGAARLGGPAGLHADGAAVVQQQPVLGVDLEGLADLPGLGHLAGELRLDRGDVVAEVLPGHRRAGEDRQVVGRGVLPRRVQPARVADRGVQRAEALGGGGHRGHGLRDPAGGVRQRAGRVVARHEEEAPGTAGAPCRWRPGPCPARLPSALASSHRAV